MDRHESLRVRYSSFDDSGSEDDLDDTSTQSVNSFYKVEEIVANHPVYFRLMRPRAPKIETTKTEEKEQEKSLPLEEIVFKDPKPPVRSKKRRLTKAERLCVALLRERIADVVTSIQTRDFHKRPQTVAVGNSANCDVITVEAERPSTRQKHSRSSSATSNFSREISEDESRMLKKVLSDILRRKASKNPLPQDGNINNENFQNRPLTPELQSGRTSQASSRKSATDRCLKLIHKKVKDKLKEKAEAVVPNDVTSGGDMNRDVTKPFEMEVNNKMVDFELVGRCATPDQGTTEFTS